MRLSAVYPSHAAAVMGFEQPWLAPELLSKPVIPPKLLSHHCWEGRRDKAASLDTHSKRETGGE